MSASAVTESPGPQPSTLRLLVDPFARLRTGTAAALAVLTVALGLVASRFGARFDGVLDVHLVPPAVPLGTALADQAVAFLAPALVAWPVLRALGGRAAFVRLAAVLGTARLPLILAAPVAFVTLQTSGGVVATTANGAAFVVDTLRPQSVPPVMPSGVATLVVAGLGLVAVLVWVIALIVAGLRAASGLRGGRLAAASTIVVLGGELLAKLALEALR